ALEAPARLVDARGLDDAALGRDVAVQDGEPPLVRVRVLDVADAALVGVVVGRVEVGVLREGHLGAHAARGREGVGPGGGGGGGPPNVVRVDRLAHGARVHG